MRLPTLQHFGACPVCHETNGYVNVSRDHWFVCDVHKLAWCVGSNLFSSWREESEEDWERNRAKLETFEVAKAAAWGWDDVPLSGLRRWAREWVRGYWWQVAGHRLHMRSVRKIMAGKSADDLPF